MNTITAKIYTWKHTNAYQLKVMLMMYFRNVALINCITPVILHYVQTFLETVTIFVLLL